jgi:transposase-like protein
MNLEKIFCPNLECVAKGQSGRGNISVHRVKEKRCGCSVCEKTFSVSKGSIFYRLKTAPQTVILVLTLLA